MLPASRARRWSSLRIGAIVVSGAKATVDINEKARDLKVPGFDLSAFVGFRAYPNSWTVSAGTSGVLIQQHTHGQQVRLNTESRFYPRRGRLPNLRRAVASERFRIGRRQCRSSRFGAA